MDYKMTPEEMAAGRAALMGGNVGGNFELLVKEAHGSTIVDMNGKEYLDCTSQAWSMNIGFSHPKVIAAVQEQVNHYMHIRTSFETVPKLMLSKRLVEMAPGKLKKVSYCLHGGNAIEGAIKLAIRNNPGKSKFITFYDGYHGRTFTSMNMCWPHPNTGFVSYMNAAVRVPQAYCYRCPMGKTCGYPKCGLQCASFLEDAVKNAVDGGPCALIMEPIQGNGGMIEYPVEFYKAVRDICDRNNMLLIWDEIQTAFCRPGTYFSSERYGVVPDVLVFGKALGGGFPIAGFLSREDLQPLSLGDQSFTFAHFPVSMAAANATLDVMEEEDICGQFREKGAYATKRLLKMKDKHDCIGDVRGPGLMIGVELVKNKETKEKFCEAEAYFVSEAFKRGVIVGGSKYAGLGNVVKLKPPAVITYKELDTVLDLYDELFTEIDKML
ncbi:MAG: aspartate aminotransferase family protein [Clostridiaceae bacterium]